MTHTIFIDGLAGTTGLQILERLDGLSHTIDIIRLDDKARKNTAKRQEAINDSDVTILCLPDDAAKEAVSLVTNPKVKILDASSAHRTSMGWAYGLPEHNSMQAQIIANNARVTNPGCYPTGAILLLAPLIRHHILDEAAPIWVHGVSGYSGGGKQLIERFETPENPDHIGNTYRAYGLNLQHKHVGEMHFYSLLKHAPLFTPAVALFYNGMMISIGLHGDILGDNAAKIYDIYQQTYSEQPYIIIEDQHAIIAEHSLHADGFKDRDDIELRVIHNPDNGQTLLTARYDNLGKGAAGAAIQNLKLMLNM